MTTFQLFFGRNIPGGGFVSDEEWASFCTLVISSRFDGFTVQDALGFWKGEQEQCKVVTICTNNSDAVHEIAEAFKRLFSQDAVGIQQLPAMSFV